MESSHLGLPPKITLDIKLRVQNLSIKMGNSNHEPLSVKFEVLSFEGVAPRLTNELLSMNDELQRCKAELLSMNNEPQRFTVQLLHINDEPQRCKAELPSMNDELLKFNTANSLFAY